MTPLTFLRTASLCSLFALGVVACSGGDLAVGEQGDDDEAAQHATSADGSTNPQDGGPAPDGAPVGCPPVAIPICAAGTHIVETHDANGCSFYSCIGDGGVGPEACPPPPPIAPCLPGQTYVPVYDSNGCLKGGTCIAAPPDGGPAPTACEAAGGQCRALSLPQACTKWSTDSCGGGIGVGCCLVP
jgi:hypothetical protein